MSVLEHQEVGEDTASQPGAGERLGRLAVDELDLLYRCRGQRRARSTHAFDRFASTSSFWRSYDVQWRFAREMFVLGERSKKYFGRGIRHGACAAKLEPDRVEGHFWLGVNQALHAEQCGGLSGARLVLKARASLKRAAEISPSYHGAGPLRVLARTEHKAPWFLGGSRKRSLILYERALQLAPSNSVTLLYCAELLLDAGDTGGAIERLQQIVDMEIDPDWESENARDKSLAAGLLAEIKTGQTR